MILDPVPPVGCVGGDGGENVDVAGGELLEVTDYARDEGKRGVEVDRVVCAPVHREEVGVSVGGVVELGAEGG